MVRSKALQDHGARLREVETPAGPPSERPPRSCPAKGVGCELQLDPDTDRATENKSVTKPEFDVAGTGATRTRCTSRNRPVPFQPTRLMPATTRWASPCEGTTARPLGACWSTSRWHARRVCR